MAETAGHPRDRQDAQADDHAALEPDPVGTDPEGQSEEHPSELNEGEHEARLHEGHPQLGLKDGHRRGQLAQVQRGRDSRREDHP